MNRKKLNDLTLRKIFFLTGSAKATGSECILWPWASMPYGRFSIMGRLILAHRFALEVKLGRALLPDEDALHSCDNPPCVNGKHLRAGTDAENTADAFARNRRALLPPVIGSQSVHAKLTEESIPAIRGLLRKKFSARMIATLAGVSVSTIYGIKHGSKWKHA